MFARTAIAVLVAIAPARAHAADPDATSLAERAAKTAERATSATDPAVAAVAAFEAHNLWLKANQADDDDGHLCAARSLLVKICARQDLSPSHRESLERSRDALGQLRCARPRRSTAAGSPSISTPSSSAPRAMVPPLGERDRQRSLSTPSNSAQMAMVRSLDERDRRRPLMHIDLQPERGAAVYSEPEREFATASTARPLDVKVEPHTLGLDLDRAAPQPRHKGLQIGGGISLALGLVALGVMTPYASRDASYAREIRSLTATKDGAGGRLTETQDERLTNLVAESRSTFRTSLALGLSGGAAALLGASLLLAGDRQLKRSLALLPSADRNSASITFQGRF